MFTSLVPGSLANIRTKIRGTYGIRVAINDIKYWLNSSKHLGITLNINIYYIFIIYSLSRKTRFYVLKTLLTC